MQPRVTNAYEGGFELTPFIGYGADKQDALIYDDASKSWINGDPSEGKYLSLKGGELDGDLTIKGELNMEGNSIINLPDVPTDDNDAASKKWVLSLIGGVSAVPTGMIAFWTSSINIPTGWFALDGSNFSTSLNPQLHTYLQGTRGYRNGQLPNWSGRFIAQRGGSNGGDPGEKLDYLTALPRTDFVTSPAGRHRHRFGNPAKVDGSASDGRMYHDPENGSAQTSEELDHEHSVNKGGDGTTRPDCVVGYWIIKGG